MTDALRLQIGTPVVLWCKTCDGSGWQSVVFQGDGCVATSNWNASWCFAQGGKTYDGCVVTSNWNASWCSAQGGKTYDGCVVTSNWNASLCLAQVARLRMRCGTPAGALLRVARLMTDAL